MLACTPEHKAWALAQLCCWLLAPQGRATAGETVLLVYRVKACLPSSSIFFSPLKVTDYPATGYIVMNISCLKTVTSTPRLSVSPSQHSPWDLSNYRYQQSGHTAKDENCFQLFVSREQPIQQLFHSMVKQACYISIGSFPTDSKAKQGKGFPAAVKGQCHHTGARSPFHTICMQLLSPVTYSRTALKGVDFSVSSTLHSYGPAAWIKEQLIQY